VNYRIPMAGLQPASHTIYTAYGRCFILYVLLHRTLPPFSTTFGRRRAHGVLHLYRSFRCHLLVLHYQRSAAKLQQLFQTFREKMVFITTGWGTVFQKDVRALIAYRLFSGAKFWKRAYT